MKTYQEIENELTNTELEPNVKLWIDNTGNIFWVTNNGEYLWLFQDGDPSSFVDENHEEIEQHPTPEAVGSTGCWWENKDLEAPFHISDFIKRISEISGSDYYERLQNELISELQRN